MMGESPTAPLRETTNGDGSAGRQIAGTRWARPEAVQPPVRWRELTAAEPSRLYPAFRNTLMTVIVLFAVYLAFEFRTLWFREFPKGFYYSGYAHEGAAWLTFALVLATAVLSLVFRGAVLHDPRLPRLRRLGWIWSAENFVLAVAVYHRLAIYINFNGRSPMRMVGSTACRRWSSASCWCSGRSATAVALAGSCGGSFGRWPSPFICSP